MEWGGALMIEFKKSIPFEFVSNQVMPMLPTLARPATPLKCAGQVAGVSQKFQNIHEPKRAFRTYTSHCECAEGRAPSAEADG